MTATFDDCDYDNCQDNIPHYVKDKLDFLFVSLRIFQPHSQMCGNADQHTSSMSASKLVCIHGQFTRRFWG